MSDQQSKVLPRINISELRFKEDVASTFLVKFIGLNESKDGKKYLNIVIGDGTGDLEGRMWQNAEEAEGLISRGDFVLVHGKLNLFQNKKQFIINQIEKIASDTVHQDDFILKAPFPPEEMFQNLLNLVNKLSDVYIRQLLLNILHDDEIARRLKLWQAGKSVHHAYRSGLLEHILSCAHLAWNLSDHYQVNENYVVAGAILHDICKIYELTDGLVVDYTEEGKLIGHLIKGLELVDRFARGIDHFPYATKMHLKHIIASHHGELEYGSPKVPQTAEAYLVHLIDFMDSKMNTMMMVKRMDNTTGNWSGFNKYLDRIVYKNELPFFDQFLGDHQSHHQQAQQQQGEQQVDKVKSEKIKSSPLATNAHSPTKDHRPKDIKTNLGKFLEGYKVDK